MQGGFRRHLVGFTNRTWDILEPPLQEGLENNGWFPIIIDGLARRVTSIYEEVAINEDRTLDH